MSAVAASPANPVAGSLFDLTAVVNDATTGGSNIAAATYAVDGGPPVAMVAQDGAFNQPTEAVLAHVPPFATGGSHTFCVTGSDAAGNVSSPSCITRGRDLRQSRGRRCGERHAGRAAQDNRCGARAGRQFR